MSIKLLVGLGNPGPRYQATRHNAGFWCLDQLASAVPAVFRQENKFQGEVSALDTSQGRLFLLKPQTFMNRSGQAIAALARFYQLAVEQVLIVHDDLDLPPGIARLKRGGGSGGHNGLKDAIACLGSPQFVRLRIGIGHPGRGTDVTHYVLNTPSTEEQAAILAAIEAALAVFPLILEGQWDKAVQQLHT